MSYKIALRDLRVGLMQPRYVITPIFFLIPCSICCVATISLNLSATWLDYILSCFAGILPIPHESLNSGFVGLPYGWLISVSGCLLLNLDYIQRDLTTEGQQYLIRLDQRKTWFFSKVIWNVASTCQYMLILAGTTLFFALSTRSRVCLDQITEITVSSYRGIIDLTESISKLSVCGVLCPFITLMALNMLQMTLCLFMKPAYSFLLTLSVVIAGIFWNTPLSIANGAMGIRVIGFSQTQAGGLPSFLLPSILSVACIFLGAWKIKRTDVFGKEL